MAAHVLQMRVLGAEEAIVIPTCFTHPAKCHQSASVLVDFLFLFHWNVEELWD